MTISKAGFEVTVEDSKSLAATAWIPTNIFSSFNFSHDGTEVFEVSLDGLLQCLNIFGGAGAAGGGKLPLLGGKKRRWAGDGERGEDDDDEWTADKRKERRTGMRLSWAGEGEPLKVLL
jgi:cell cycle checkpoint protein